MQKKKRNIKIIVGTTIVIVLLLLLLFSKNLIQLQNKNKPNISENVARGATMVEPNVPVISAGMIPVKLDGSNLIITTAKDKNWYDYESGKPAYIMLNDGYYKSELEVEITKEQLMQNNVGTDVPDDPKMRGSIYVWIPRFAYNEEGDIKYVNGIENTEEGWTIPEMFAFRQASETVPDFLLTGVWVGINTDANIDRNSNTNEYRRKRIWIYKKHNSTSK